MAILVRLGVLSSDGSLDNGFNPNAGVTRNGRPFPVTALAIQPDGAILIGGLFRQRQRSGQKDDRPAEPQRRLGPEFSSARSQAEAPSMPSPANRREDPGGGRHVEGKQHEPSKLARLLRMGAWTTRSTRRTRSTARATTFCRWRTVESSWRATTTAAAVATAVAGSLVR